ncbi:MAG: hypothetical protein GC182_07760 [Rhodopseudomonas sp.]|nr:hypothetical protein [Rhodopseudomonas sp.]
MHRYRVCGLTVGSDIMLPGLNAATSATPTHDVTIELGTTPTSLSDATANGPTWQIAGQQFLLAIPGIARFLLTDGHHITVTPDTDGDPTDIPIFILGTVFGILLHQRGQIVLHASAVRVNGKAVLFCGRSGSGKSTMAAALAKHGFPVVADDVGAISITAGATPTVHPEGRHLKLWAQAIDRLDLAAGRGDRVRRRLEKYYVAPDDVFVQSLPLAAIYILREARPPHRPGIEQQAAIDGALALRQNAYRPHLVNRMGQKTDYFRAASAIVNSASLFTLTRPLDFKAMPAVIASLEQNWQDIGLLDKAA